MTLNYSSSRRLSKPGRWEAHGAAAGYRVPKGDDAAAVAYSSSDGLGVYQRKGMRHETLLGKKMGSSSQLLGSKKVPSSPSLSSLLPLLEAPQDRNFRISGCGFDRSQRSKETRKHISHAPALRRAKTARSQQVPSTVYRAHRSDNCSGTMLRGRRVMSAPGGRRLREGESDNNLVVTPSARCRTPPEKSIAELQPEEKPVTFTELDDGQMIVERSQRKREAHPERLDLDRRRLRACPVIKNDDRLRLLNLQNNNIESISNLQNLPHLRFLDLYNNQLKTLDGTSLQVSRALRVLMLGKNEIDHVSELETLTKLDVLDLHSNRLTSVMGLSGLPALRILNLSGNRIEDVWQLGALRRLTELNLRRNELERLSGLDSLKSLRRLFLSNNRLASFEDCQCVLKMVSLVELAMDGNPLAAQNTTTGSPYRQMILTALPALKHLDLKRITEQERKTCNANAALRRADEKQAERVAKIFSRIAAPVSQIPLAATLALERAKKQQDRPPTTMTDSEEEESRAGADDSTASQDNHMEEQRSVGEEEAAFRLEPVSNGPGTDVDIFHDSSPSLDLAMHVYGDEWSWMDHPNVVAAAAMITSASFHGTPIRSLDVRSRDIASCLPHLQSLGLEDNGIDSLAELEMLGPADRKTWYRLDLGNNPVAASTSAESKVALEEWARSFGIRELNGMPLAEPSRDASDDREKAATHDQFELAFKTAVQELTLEALERMHDVSFMKTCISQLL